LSQSHFVPYEFELPRVIQGGMGVGVSNWKLARAVSRLGQLGVVSGTVIDTVLARRLQDGDVGGHMRRALEHFPISQVASEALAKFFRPDGRAPGEPYVALPMYQQLVSRAREQFTMLASFVEVHLAKEDHDGLVGINLLTKVQMPNLALLYGAMLAGVDFVLMGAGIPREIPAALDAMAAHQPAQMRLDLEDAAPGEVEQLFFDPRVHWDAAAPTLRRPRFLPIVASNSLATMLVKKATSRVDGFVIEGPTAGGHNAPPRGNGELSEAGEPVYGPRDEVDLAQIGALGLPFWVAGGAGRPERLAEVRAAGAAGVQVGTLFAYCDESGIAESIRRSVLENVVRGTVRVRTDARASPTGFPFKVVSWDGDPATGVKRERVCDLGYLRNAYARPGKTPGYRCASEPEDQFEAKGGAASETPGRKCLCNALLATIGLAQTRDDGWVEPPLLTSGDDLTQLSTFLAGRTHYAASDVLDYLLGRARA
jgi:NAD(P)H-dependent flavin oxidoreductase YrpB (nitropropane dioxygenase family)